jgi:pimeloyl-ACP methyl ester carboxylesterase
MDEFVVRRWRRLAVRRWGDPDGQPVFLLHGTPGSRLGVRPLDDELRRLGVCLITYDRPGYGRSDPHPGRSVADAAGDVRAIADSFGYRTFAVLGRSGGGPHALACAALLPGRVTRVASLVGLAPYGVAGLDWSDGMVESNRLQYTAAMGGRKALSRVLYPHVVAMRDNPGYLLDRLGLDAPADRGVIDDPQYRATTINSLSEAIERSLDGWASDNLAFIRPWGFDPHWIEVPTLLWHGVRDVFSPVAHAHWLAERIKGAILHLSRDSHHHAAAAMQVPAIAWLISSPGWCPAG